MPTAKTSIIYDWKVTGSSLGNNFLCKKRGKAAHNMPKMVGPLPELSYAGALVHQVAPVFFLMITTIVMVLKFLNLAYGNFRPQFVSR